MNDPQQSSGDDQAFRDFALRIGGDFDDMEIALLRAALKGEARALRERKIAAFPVEKLDQVKLPAAAASGPSTRLAVMGTFTRDASNVRSMGFADLAHGPVAERGGGFASLRWDLEQDGIEDPPLGAALIRLADGMPLAQGRVVATPDGVEVVFEGEPVEVLEGIDGGEQFLAVTWE